MYSLSNYINTQKRNKIYKRWYTQKQYLDIKLFGISRKKKIYIYIYIKIKNKKKQKGDVSSKSIEAFIIVVVMSC